MDIICENCKSKFRIADKKLTPGKTTYFKCAKCAGRIAVKAPEPEEDDFMGFEDEMFSFDEDDTDEENYDTSDKPFDFVEEEGKSALLCEPRENLKEKIKPVLDVLEYHVTEVSSSREALKKMRYHSYDVIVVNEFFDTKNPEANGVLIFLERLNMATRRNIFVALITDRFRTMDNMAAFHKSVNIIVNVDNIDDFDKIIRRGLTDHGLFYQIFNESLH